MKSGLRSAFKLLSALCVDSGRRSQERYEKHWQGLLNRRDDSIMAHGVVPLDSREVFDKFLDEFDETFRLSPGPRFPKLLGDAQECP